MKTLLIMLTLACALFVAGCGNGSAPGAATVDGAGSSDTVTVSGETTGPSLQAFVLNNCGTVTDGQSMSIDGASFPASDTDDPTQSVYARNCLNL